MERLIDVVGGLGFALLLGQFIAAWYERKRIYGK